MSAISLSLVSHTNVGKTTLMRTLLRQDVGEVADRPHVTEAAEAGVLVQTREGDVMPQKSTYFYPKALTGLVINPHEW